MDSNTLLSVKNAGTLARMNLVTTLTDEEKHFYETVGDLVEQWGFKRHLGRVWAYLYLRQTPQSPATIQEALNISPGNLHSFINELITWGVIRKVRISGERSYYYEVDGPIWQSISNVLQTRELRILQQASNKLKELEKSLSEKTDDSASVFQSKQIQHVLATIDTVRSLAELVVLSSPGKLEKIAKIIQKLRSM